MSMPTDRMWAYIDGQELQGKAGTLDVTGADNIEILLSADRQKLWINNSTHCLLRVYGMRGIVMFDDMRDHGGKQLRAWIEREKRYAAKLERERRRRRETPRPITTPPLSEFELKIHALISEIAMGANPT